MGYPLIAGILLLVSLLLLLGAGRTLLKGRWLFLWLRGSSGILLLGGSILLGGIAWDLLSYRELLDEEPLARVSFRQLGDQSYLATVTETNGDAHNFELSGDQWMVDARIFKWKGWVARLGVKPGYRLERISGRYSLLEHERQRPRSVYAIAEGKAPVDIWRWAHDTEKSVSWLDATYGNAVYAPMADGADFDVYLTHFGLLARPVNSPAAQALRHWP